MIRAAPSSVPEPELAYGPSVRLSGQATSRSRAPVPSTVARIRGSQGLPAW